MPEVPPTPAASTSLPSPQRAGLAGATVVLGVSGGIAAYKAADLASKLVQAGATVHVAMTEGATRFVQPLTFQALTHHPVFTSVFEGWDEGGRGHVTLAANADVVVVAPATANTIARLAAGMTDDMLGAICLATEAPLVIAPAMEHHMWHHPATQANLATLRARGVSVVEPERGYLASGARGDGRLAAVERILGETRRALGLGGPLAGRRIVVSAGGTREALDPVRYLGNRSSGTMGVAIAEAAVSRGAEVTLIAGPTLGSLPAGMAVVPVESARDMADAVAAAVVNADVLVMAAAVADFRPRTQASGKIKKQPGQDSLQIDLVRNPDIIAETTRPGLIKVGFAAETDDLEANARAKIVSKGLAMIVANDAVRTIGSVESEAMFLYPDREAVRLPTMPKAELAERIVDAVQALIAERGA
ncbi:MAG: bifunctional phosphopantothenoylcysteine decarboxylase/phosphopantothenate--cysteine ligase CoaBC [Thermomicrobiales bacterium]